MSKLLLVLTLLVSSVFGVPPVRRQAGLIALPASNIGLLRDAALPHLQDEILAAGDELLSTAKLVNDTKPGCIGIVEGYLQGACKVCVENKCQQQADSCSPSLWAFLIQQVEDFFGSNVNMMLTALETAAGFPGFVADVFHLDELDDVFVDVGTGVVNTFLDVGNVFGELAGSAVNVGTSIWDGATDVAGALSNAFFGVGSSVLGGLGNLGGVAIDGFLSTIGGAINGFGNLLGDLFTRQMMRNAILKHHARRQVRSVPTCQQLQNEGGTACLYYASTCGNTCDSEWLQQQYCTTFNSAVTAYQTAVQDHFWVTTIPANNQNFVIDQVLVDGSSYDVAAGGYTSTTVTATLFGETYTFTLDAPLTMFDMTQAGREIAQKALERYKANHTPPTTKKV